MSVNAILRCIIATNNGLPPLMPDCSLGNHDRISMQQDNHVTQVAMPAGTPGAIQYYSKQATHNGDSQMSLAALVKIALVNTSVNTLVKNCMSQYMHHRLLAHKSCRSRSNELNGVCKGKRIVSNSLEAGHMLEGKRKRDVDARPSGRQDCQKNPQPVTAVATERVDLMQACGRVYQCSCTNL